MSEISYSYLQALLMKNTTGAFDNRQEYAIF